MARTVIALFEQTEHARDAVKDLTDNGFESERISLVVNDSRTEDRELEHAETSDDIVNDVSAGAGIGAVLGGITGLVIGLGAFTVPGIGLLIAAGPLATTLAGLGVGAAAGGLVGALTNLGVREQEAEAYAEGVRRGGTLVMVETDEERSNLAVDILNQHQPVDMERRSTEWRQAGWEGFKAGGEPLSADELGVDHRKLVENERPNVHGYKKGAQSEKDVYDDEFELMTRSHFEETYAASPLAYEDLDPAYRYGLDLAREERYREMGWEEVERDARRDWENREREHEWEDYRNAIRHGWLLGTRR
jgi:uncharacterized membrane protein